MDECWDRSVTALFQDEFTRDAFLLADVAALRAAFVRQVWVPPPHLEVSVAMPGVAETVLELSPPGQTFVCKIDLGFGNKCGATFPSHKQLSAHQRQSAQFGHVIRSTIHAATHSNTCLFGCTASINKDEAAKHATRSWIQGRCIQGITRLIFQPSSPSSLACPLCSESFNSEPELRSHVRSHIPLPSSGPPVKVKQPKILPLFRLPPLLEDTLHELGGAFLIRESIFYVCRTFSN